MTLLTVVKDVCATVGVATPQSVFSGIASNRTMQEMLSLANEMAQRIAYDTRDWVKLKTTATCMGNGVLTAFPLPANFKRMLLTANVWRSTSAIQPMMFVPDTDEWLNRRAQNVVSAWGEWTLLGDAMHIFPALGIVPPPAWVSAGTPYKVGDRATDIADASMWECRVLNTPFGPGTFADYRAAHPTHWSNIVQGTAYFAYLDKNCVSLASGGRGDAFMSDGDSFTLDERCLKLAMIW